MEANRRKRKDKSYYVNAAKKAKMAKYRMVPGAKGFLLFCNHHEKETVREGYRILNQFADEIYGKEEESRKKSNAGEEKEKEKEGRGEGDADDDVDAALEREKMALDEVAAKEGVERRFQVVDSGVQNLVFIRTTVESPVELAESIMKEVQASGTQISRYLLRLVPVEVTCKAFSENVEEAAKPIIFKRFHDKGEVSYCIQFKSRLNGSFGREEAYKIVGKMVKEANPQSKVEFKHPEYVILVEVMKSFCCISILSNYFGFKKYNILELANAQQNVDKLANDAGSSTLVKESEIADEAKECQVPSDTSGKKIEEIKDGENE